MFSGRRFIPRRRPIDDILALVVELSLAVPLCVGAMSTQGRRQVKKCGVDTHGERGARAYNGGLEAEPPAGSRQSPWSGGQGTREARRL